MHKNTGRKILVVLPWSAYGTAGVERFTQSLVDNLDAKYLHITVVVIAPRSLSRDMITKAFATHVSVEILYADHARHSILRLARLITNIKPDRIVSNVAHICITTLIAKYIVFSRARCISVQHSFEPNTRFLLYAIIIGIFSYRVVVVSEAIKLYYKKYIRCVVHKVIVIPNGFDLDLIKKKAREHISADDQNIFSEKRTLVSVSRLESEKNITFLLQAFASIPKEHLCNTQLLIIGDGDQRLMLESLARSLEIVSVVHFLGWKDNPYPYIAQSDMLVVSSDFEGFGRVLVEAMALGVPVVSTDCPGGPREILDNGAYGILVPLGDSDAMVDAIITTLERQHDRERLMSYAKQFSSEKTVQAFARLLI